MTKEQCTAIIQAIQVSTTALLQYGIVTRDRLSMLPPDVTAQATQITTYEAAITDIINNIPDDPEPADDQNNEEPQDNNPDDPPQNDNPDEET